MFDATVERGDDGVVSIRLWGELDAAAAPTFQQRVAEAAAHQPRVLVLHLGDLAYLSSAGIRVLVFAHQKMPAGIDLYAVAPQAQVLETLEMTGVAQSVIVVDAWNGEPAAPR